MPTRFIQQATSVADQYTGSHAGIGVNSSTGKLTINPDGTKRIVATDGAEVLTAADTLVAADHGKTFYLDAAAGFAVTLPSPVLGYKYSVVIKTAPSSGNYTVVSASSANIIKGHVLTSDVNSGTDPDLETSGGDTVSFVASKAVAGDRADFETDGTSWFVSARCTVFDAITITTAS